MTNLYVRELPASRRKLGLSLAGGGFRASLFHIGVLRRLAEMDVLREVEVLSTVSGGSIVGALYILMLKAQLDRTPDLSRDDYVTLVKGLQDTFVAGVQKDLRTLLIMNPFGMLSVLTSHDSLGRRMGRIYQRHLYRGAVAAIGIKQKALSNLLWPGWMPLQKLRFAQDMPNGIEAYNQQATSAGRSAIPNFIMNATSLNSGAPFRLSSNEIGDPRLGYFRWDEIGFLKSRKSLLESSPARLSQLMKQAGAPGGTRQDLLPRDIALAQWWIARKSKPSPPAPDAWALFGDSGFAQAAQAMCETNFGRLRQLKLPAWYVRVGQNYANPVTGGYDPSQHRARFNSVLREVEPALPPGVAAAVGDEKNELGNELLDFAIELYYLRSAEAMSWGLEDDFARRISLGTAVAASANFPPVFPPLILLGIYDDLHVSRLGLSDGGVYDNMGITTLVDEGCSHIIASDTGAPFEVKQRVAPRYTGMIARLPAVLMEDVADQQRTRLRERARLSGGVDGLMTQPPPLAGGKKDAAQALKEQYGLAGLAFFSIDALNPPGANGIDDLICDPQEVACIRTDLDAFGDMEVAALINTGYDRTDRFLKGYLDDSRSLYWASPVNPPFPPTERYRANIARVVEIGKSRMFRALRMRSLRCLPSWAAIALAVFLTIYFGGKEYSLKELIDGIPAAILYWLEHPFLLLTWLEKRHPPFAIVTRGIDRMVNLPIPAWGLVLGPVALLLLIFLGWPMLAKRFKESRSTTGRWLVTRLKWVRAFAPALLFVAALTPLWIAIAACVIGAVSYLCFNLPYLWATKME